MDRRVFLTNLAAGAASLECFSDTAAAAEPADSIDIEGHTLLCEFQHDNANWKVYEDLRTRDGVTTFVSSRGATRVLPKRTEPAFDQSETLYLGLKPEDIGRSGPDLLADKLLENGDPDEETVRLAAPPLGAGPRNPQPGGTGGGGGAVRWGTFVGTKECSDTMPVFPGGNTRTYHPVQDFAELTAEATRNRYEGLIGGWMPAVRKVMPGASGAYTEVVVFGDVEAKDRFIVQTWHRTSRIENGKVTQVVYGYSYPPFPPARQDPRPEQFYRALLVFADYWDRQLKDYAATTLPREDWVNMSRHAVAKEIMVRPGGVYPKYGAVDRDYYGSEYDGFQDIFTMSVYTNLELGRFEPARAILDNYLTDFTDSKGMINMRGPETAQFGMTLMLLAKYHDYTRDTALLAKHRGKIEATARLLMDMHDECLKRPQDDPGYGIIHGWSESDACLNARPATWWLPYYANNAFSARGLRDIARVWGPINRTPVAEWQRRSKVMQDALVATMEKNVRADLNPPYIGPFAGSKGTFREGFAERPNVHQWTHRPYAELLQADMLPPRLANLVIDTMRAYGATTMGVVANVGGVRPGVRPILGFISCGYAQMLLRLDRVEEYLLFLYAHRYHDHTPGSWTAGEVAGQSGGTATFCIPAQQTIPLLVRWMLVLEDSDEDRLYIAKGVPRAWAASGKPIGIDQAPTRWGRVSFQMRDDISAGRVTSTVDLARGAAPRELHVKLRMPAANAVRSATVNSRPATLGGPHNDTVIITPGAERHFEVVGQLG